MTLLLQEMVTVSMDGSVLERIAKIMTYLRLGSSGKVLKKKKKERDKRCVHENKCYTRDVVELESENSKASMVKTLEKYAKVFCLAELMHFSYILSLVMIT
jgi:hypothetical protein